MEKLKATEGGSLGVHTLGAFAGIAAAISAVTCTRFNDGFNGWLNRLQATTASAALCKGTLPQKEPQWKP